MKNQPGPLAVIETHPVQYHAPVYRAVAERGVPVHAIYGSDFSVAGYLDKEFGKRFAWDTNLLDGYESTFLARVADGGAANFSEVTAVGIDAALDGIKPAALLLSGYSPAFYRVAAKAARRRRIPLFFRGEATDHARQRSWFKRNLRDAFLRSFYARCSRFLYIGERAKMHYRRLGVPDSKLIFSPYCVNEEVFSLDATSLSAKRAALRNELAIADDVTLILFSGKLIPVKAPEIILRAMQLLPEAVRSKTALAFLGDGELRASLETASQAIEGLRALFLGFQNQQKLTDYYAAADLLILSSVSETWGLVVNEALLHGVPCVTSTQVGCAPDLVIEGETGASFPSGDANECAAAILRARELRRLPETKTKCRERVRRYGVDAAADGFVRAYREIQGAAAT